MTLLQGDALYKALLDNLTATQERCNTLLEEAREARRERDAYRLTAKLLAEELDLTRRLLEDAIEALEGLVPPEGPVN